MVTQNTVRTYGVNKVFDLLKAYGERLILIAHQYYKVEYCLGSLSINVGERKSAKAKLKNAGNQFSSTVTDTK